MASPELVINASPAFAIVWLYEVVINAPIGIVIAAAISAFAAYQFASFLCLYIFSSLSCCFFFLSSLIFTFLFSNLFNCFFIIIPNPPFHTLLSRMKEIRRINIRIISIHYSTFLSISIINDFSFSNSESRVLNSNLYGSSSLDTIRAPPTIG